MAQESTQGPDQMKAEMTQMIKDLDLDQDQIMQISQILTNREAEIEIAQEELKKRKQEIDRNTHQEFTTILTPEQLKAYKEKKLADDKAGMERRKAEQAKRKAESAK